MKYFGCAWYPEAWPEERLLTDIRLMKEAGINAVRMGEFNWGKFEPREGCFAFDDYLRLLEKLHENGIAVLMCTPTAAPPKWMNIEYFPSCHSSSGRFPPIEARGQTDIKSAKAATDIFFIQENNFREDR